RAARGPQSRIEDDDRARHARRDARGADPARHPPERRARGIGQRRARRLMAAFRPLVSLAWRESRTARRKLLLYMSSISLGVAALVAIDSFSANIIQSVKEQSRALMGGDLSFDSS